MTENSKTEGHLVIERSQHKKINREIYTCVSILLFAGSPNHAGQAWYGIQLYIEGSPGVSSNILRVRLGLFLIKTNIFKSLYFRDSLIQRPRGCRISSTEGGWAHGGFDS